MSELAETKKIYLLASEPNKLLTAATQFLLHRGYELNILTDLGSFMKEVTTQQPQFIFVSVDFPNSKITSLPQYLKQAGLSATVVGLAEKITPQSTNRLIALDVSYRLYPPFSGPSFERLLKKIEKELAQASQAQVQKESQVGWVYNNGMIDESCIDFGESNVSKDNLLVFDKDSKSAVAQNGSDQAKQERAELKMFSNEAAKLHKYDSGGEPQSQLHKKTQDSSVRGIDDESASFSNELAELHKYSDLEHKKRNQNADPSSSPELREDLGSTPLKAATPERPLIGKELGMTAEEIEKNEIEQEIEYVENAHCLIIESQAFTGYALVVLSAGMKLSQEVAEFVKARLLEYLNLSQGTEIPAGDFQLKLKSVYFNKWTKNQAEFLKKSNFNGKDLAVAFFPRDTIQYLMTPSERADLVGIPLFELKGNSRLEFNAYLHLKKNNKYLLYVPDQQILSDSQRSRLLLKGQTEVLVHKAAISELKRYKAQNFLQDHIAKLSTAKAS